MTWATGARRFLAGVPGPSPPVGKIPRPAPGTGPETGKLLRKGPPSSSAWMVRTWGVPLSRRDRTRRLKFWGRQPFRPRSSSRVGRVVGISNTFETVWPKRGKYGASPRVSLAYRNSGPPVPGGCFAALPARGGKRVGRAPSRAARSPAPAGFPGPPFPGAGARSGRASARGHSRAAPLRGRPRPMRRQVRGRGPDQGRGSKVP